MTSESIKGSGNSALSKSQEIDNACKTSRARWANSMPMSSQGTPSFALKSFRIKYEILQHLKVYSKEDHQISSEESRKTDSQYHLFWFEIPFEEC